MNVLNHFKYISPITHPFWTFLGLFESWRVAENISHAIFIQYKLTCRYWQHFKVHTWICCDLWKTGDLDPQVCNLQVFFSR